MSKARSEWRSDKRAKSILLFFVLGKKKKKIRCVDVTYVAKAGDSNILRAPVKWSIFLRGFAPHGPLRTVSD